MDWCEAGVINGRAMEVDSNFYTLALETPTPILQAAIALCESIIRSRAEDVRLIQHDHTPIEVPPTKKGTQSEIEPDEETRAKKLELQIELYDLCVMLEEYGNIVPTQHMLGQFQERCPTLDELQEETAKLRMLSKTLPIPRNVPAVLRRKDYNCAYRHGDGNSSEVTRHIRQLPHEMFGLQCIFAQQNNVELPKIMQNPHAYGREIDYVYALHGAVTKLLVSRYRLRTMYGATDEDYPLNPYFTEMRWNTMMCLLWEYRVGDDVLRCL